MDAKYGIEHTPRVDLAEFDHVAQCYHGVAVDIKAVHNGKKYIATVRLLDMITDRGLKAEICSCEARLIDTPYNSNSYKYPSSEFEKEEDFCKNIVREGVINRLNSVGECILENKGDDKPECRYGG